MTIVNYLKHENVYHVSIYGHADYNKGEDIVCSAVSILGFTLMNMIGNALPNEAEIKYQSGEINVVIRSNEEKEAEIKTIISTILTGFDLLEQQYPNHVMVERKC